MPDAGTVQVGGSSSSSYLIYDDDDDSVFYNDVDAKDRVHLDSPPQRE